MLCLLVLSVGLAHGLPMHRPEKRATEVDPKAPHPYVLANKFEGDIDMTDQEHDFLRQEQAQDGVQDPDRRWEGGIIPYYIPKDEFGPEQLRSISVAIRTVERYTCIRFAQVAERPMSLAANYVILRKGSDGCHTNVGRKGGAQELWLANSCFLYGTGAGVVLHELMHAIGFHHEQTRPDRDEYIEIVWDNIPTEKRRQFEKRNKTELAQLQTTYDYGSIMHYPERLYDERVVMKPKVSVDDAATRMGQRRGLSTIDVKRINILYSCSRR